MTQRRMVSLRSCATVGLLMGPLVLGCSRAQADPESDAQPDALVVVTRAPERGDYQLDLVLPGTFEPFERAELYTQVTGYLSSVEVEIGDTVKAGQIVARVLVPEMRGEVQSAQAALLASQAEIRRSKESTQLAKLEKDRRESLRKTEAGAIAQADVDAAVATHELAQAESEKAAAAKKSAKAELSRLRAVAGFAVVHAPFSGVVTMRYLDPGALARVGTSSNAQAILEIQRVDSVRLVLQIPESLVPHVGADHELSFTTDAFPGESWTARISRVSGAMDPRTRSLRAEVDVVNDGGRFVPGMSADVTVTATSVAGALTIPSSALRGTGEARWVAIVEDEIMVKREVTVLSDTGKVAIIKGGLSDKDAVVVAGSPLVELGDRVAARPQ